MFNPRFGSSKTHPAVRAMAPLAALAISAGPAGAQDLTWKAPPQNHPIAIVNATIHPVSSAPIENGFIFFDQGRIRRIGTMDDAPVFIGTTEIIDATGLHVYPGLIGPAARRPRDGT